MDPARLEEIEELYHSAREREPNQRTVFLAEACRGDEELRREVESLLAQAGPGGIMEGSVSGLAAHLLVADHGARYPAGTLLGPYQVESTLGAGGMAQVFKARDTRLGRAVAVKIAHQQFSQRFEREARAISALNHPHICTLYDVGPDYLVMELVEGETLEALLRKGALSLELMLRYGGQIADALTAAHAQGITHRDLKPGNIMVTRSGIKVLDFGLARIAPSPNAAHAPALTAQHAAIGTLAYMAPEQLEGKECDARSDIFSFGLVLYEMTAGRRPFIGRTDLELVQSVIHAAPQSLGESVPVILQEIVEKALEKAPADRYQSMLEMVVDLRRLERRTLGNAAWKGTLSGVAKPRAEGKTNSFLGWIAAAAVALLAIAGWYWLRAGVVVPATELMLSFYPKPGSLAAIGDQKGTPEISPDGSAIIFYGSSGVQLRRLNSLEQESVRAHSTGGGENAGGAPGFWSADSKNFVFGEGDSLKRIRLPDGAVETVAKGLTGAMFGGSLSDSGTILVSLVQATIHLYTVPASGGELKPVEVSGLESRNFVLPQFLPGGDEFLFADRSAEDPGLFLATLRGGKAVNPVLLLKNPTGGRYTPAGGGRLLFVRDDALYSQRLNRAARRLEGEPLLLQRGVASSPKMQEAHFSVSRNGALAWRPGRAALSQVTILDRRGRVVGTAGPPSIFSTLKLAPDEKHLLLAEEGTAWMLEPNRPGRLRVSQGGTGTIMSPDGARFLERIFDAKGPHLIERPADGSGQARELAMPPGFARAYDISPDGKTMLFNRGAIDTGVFEVRLDAGEAVKSLVQTGENIGAAMFSPDGHWILYEASGRGSDGIYVQPFPGPGLRQQIANRGISPVWRKDGREIAYLDQFEGKDYLWSVSVAYGSGKLRASTPAPLFPVRLPATWLADLSFLAVSRDGLTFYMPQALEQPDSGVIHVKIGWLKP